MYVCVFSYIIWSTHTCVFSSALSLRGEWMNACRPFEQVPFCSRALGRSHVHGSVVHASRVRAALPRAFLCLWTQEARALALSAALHHRRCRDHRTCTLLSEMHNRQPGLCLANWLSGCGEQGLGPGHGGDPSADARTAVHQHVEMSG